METRKASRDEAIRILEEIRDIHDGILLDIGQIQSLGNLLEFADYGKLGELLDNEFGPNLNGIIERVLEAQKEKLDKIYAGSGRVLEIIGQAKAM